MPRKQDRAAFNCEVDSDIEIIIYDSSESDDGSYPLGNFRDEVRRRKESVRKKQENEMHGFHTTKGKILPSMETMKSAKMSDKDISKAIDYYYAHGSDVEKGPYGFRLDRLYGNFEKPSAKDAAQKAQGIYYFDSVDPDRDANHRKLFVPSLKDYQDTGLKSRAEALAEHMMNNETFGKSEYAWEADAWSYVFRRFRKHPLLAVDKHPFSFKNAKTDANEYILTGETSTVKRIPDATFGFSVLSEELAQTLADPPSIPRNRYTALRQNWLDILHHNCGFIADPRPGDANLVFPWGVYEAKGWAGDCREARRQALTAGATYLDILDSLARTPGLKDEPREYQTEESQNYQVFALTSFGAQWHLLVGYRRPRKRRHEGNIGRMNLIRDSDRVHSEHIEKGRVSDTVYIFQRIWSGRVVNEKPAYELLSLLDQIYDWALSTHREFVLRHLAPWNEFCEKQLFGEDRSARRKEERRAQRERNPDEDIKRKCTMGKDYDFPACYDRLDKITQRKVQAKADKIWGKMRKYGLSKEQRRENIRGMVRAKVDAMDSKATPVAVD